MKRKYKVILTLIFIVYLNNLKMEVRVGYADLRLDNKDEHSNSFGGQPECKELAVAHYFKKQ